MSIAFYKFLHDFSHFACIFLGSLSTKVGELGSSMVFIDCNYQEKSWQLILYGKTFYYFYSTLKLIRIIVSVYSILQGIPL